MIICHIMVKDSRLENEESNNEFGKEISEEEKELHAVSFDS